MANLGRQIGNNNGSQDSFLRAVGHDIDQNIPRSDLSNPKDKALSEDILAKISEKLNMSEESLGTYFLDLTSKSIDSTLARIVDVVTKSSNSSFSKEQLSSLKELLSELAESKENSSSEKQSTAEVIESLQKMFDEQSQGIKDSIEENSEKNNEDIRKSIESFVDKNKNKDKEDVDFDSIYELAAEKIREKAAKKFDESLKKHQDTKEQSDDGNIAAVIKPYAKTLETIVDFKPNDVTTNIVQEIENTNNNFVDNIVENSTSTIVDNVNSTVDNIIENSTSTIVDNITNVETSVSRVMTMIDGVLTEIQDVSAVVADQKTSINGIEVPAEPNLAVSPVSDIEVPTEPNLAASPVPDIEVPTEPNLAASPVPDIEVPAELDLSPLIDDLGKNLEETAKIQSNTANIASQLSEISDLTETALNYADLISKNTISGIEKAATLDDSQQDSVIQAIQKLEENIDSAIQLLCDRVQEIHENTSIFSSSIFAMSDKLANIGLSMTKGFSNVVGNIDAKAKSIALAPFNAIGNLVKGPFVALSNTMSKIGSAVKDGMKNVMSSVADGLKSAALAPLKAIGSLFSAINPFKQKKKKKSAEELKLAQMIDKVNNFIDNFFDEMLKHVDMFLDRVLASAKKMVTQLMAHVFMWLLVNVALIGAVLALVILLIADPLMKVLQPIMDFIESIITKILDFLVPIRDNILIPLGQFILEVLKSVWELVIEPLMRGIGAILDSIKILVEALQPWIKPLVDTIMPIWLSILDTVGKLFEILKPVILALGKFLAGVFMDILTAVGWTYDNIVKPIVKAIAGFIKFISNIGRALMDKLLEGLSHLPLVGHFFKPSGKKDDISEINDLASAKAEIARLNGKIEQLQSGSEIGALQKDLEEKSKRLVEVDAGTLLTVADKLDELFKYVKDTLTEKINSLLTGTAAKQTVSVEQDITTQVESTNVQIEQIEADVEPIVPESLYDVILEQSQQIMLSIEDVALNFEDMAIAIHDSLAGTFMKVADIFLQFQDAQAKMLIDVAQAAAPFLEKAQEAINVILSESEVSNENEMSAPKISTASIVALKEASNSASNDMQSIQKTVETSDAESSKSSKFNKILLQHLNRMSDTMSSNFAAILEKLDDKPNLLPMPILTSANPNNLATMENV